MDTTKIKAFLLVEKTGSFSKAAEEFSYTPSAFSHMADSFEQELGIKLYHRTRKGVKITEAGMQLKKDFTAMIEAEQTLLAHVAEQSKVQKGTLRIGALPSIALHVLPDILNGFKQQYPAIQTTIMVDDKLSDWIKDDICDVVFTDHCPEGEVKWIPMFEDIYAAVVPKGILEGKESVCLEELYAFPFIRTQEPLLDGYLDYQRFGEIIKLNSVEDSTAVSLVKGNIGVAVLPGLSITEPPEGVRVLRLEPRKSRMLGFAIRNGKLPDTAAWFVRYMQADGRNIFAS